MYDSGAVHTEMAPRSPRSPRLKPGLICRHCLRISFELVRRESTVIIRIRWPANLRMRNNAIASNAAEIFHALPTLIRIALDELAQAVIQIANHVRADRGIQHRRSANLHGAASQQEVIDRLPEIRHAANSRERLVRKCAGHGCHLRE